MLLHALLLPIAAAQSVERPVLPFRSVAGEDGAHVLYANPALMNFDRDAMYGAWYDATSLDPERAQSSIALATSGSGLGAGLGYRQTASGGAWWTLSSGVSVELAKAFAMGSALHWHFPDGANDNFVSWDIGLGWRPAPFLGFGASALNLGNPAPTLGVNTKYDAGVAIRPFADVVTLGVDFLVETPPSADSRTSLNANVRLRPLRGIWLRGWAERGFEAADATSFGGAIELHIADVGVGVDTRMSSAATGDAGIGGYVTSVAKDDQLFLPGRQVAEFDFDGAYPYQPVGGLFQAPPEGYLSLLRRIDSAADDPRIRGILLKLKRTPFSFAQIEEIRGIIGKARAHGKPVVAYLDQETGNGAYLLAAACDKIYLHPAGSLDVVGLNAEIQYFRGTLDLVGVEAQYAKRAEYKSGPEPWTNTAASDPAREEMNALLDDLYTVLVDGVAKGRGKTPDEIRTLVDTGPFTANEAMKSGLIDGLSYPDELDETLEGVFPEDFHLADDYGLQLDTSGWAPQRAVAVVIVDGAINDGPSSSGGFLSGPSTGSETVVKQLEQAARTKSIKAVVLRVDSPGGSAFASDEIWRAVEEVKKRGKPVIVSMGGYAASGGYYVAAGADTIYAEPSTITGSIGVYGGKYSAAGLFEKLGVRSESYDRGRNAGMFSMARPFDAVEFAALDRMIGETYAQFKDRVGKGRALDAAQVEEVARGRVWSGTDAKDRHLVDEFGGFFDAVDRARIDAGMGAKAPYDLVTFDAYNGSGNTFPTQLVSLPRQIKRALEPKVELPKEIQPFWQLAALRDEHVFAMMPYRVDVH